MKSWTPDTPSAQTIDVAHWARQLEAHLQGTDIALLEIQAHGVCLRLQRVPDGQGVSPQLRALPARVARPSDVTPQTPPGKALAPPASVLVCAGSVGRLRLAHPLRTQALVQPGQRVRRGQALALLQVGAVLLPVFSPGAGRVLRWLARDGAVVGYGEPLLEMQADDDKETNHAD